MTLSGLRLLWGILRFDSAALERVENTVQAARRSFLLWVMTAPCLVLSSYSAEHGYLLATSVSLEAYALLRLVACLGGMGAGYLLVWKACRLEKLTDNFPRFVIAHNWVAWLSAVVAALLNFSTRNTIFLRDDIIRLGIVEYCIALIYLWFISWQSLRCSPFFAAGIVVLLLFPADVFNSLTNLLLFDSIRPFYDHSLAMK